MSAKVECPGCGGEMTKGSRLCRGCRHEAIEIGVNAITGRRRPGADGAPMITPGKSSAYHAKANELADRTGQFVEDVKQRTTAWASQTFGRRIESSKELTSEEASVVLDHLADEIRAAKLAQREETHA